MFVPQELGWSLASWTPIIRERRFVPWLVSEPTREEQRDRAPITTSQIYRLEDLWKAKPNATLIDLENPDEAEDDVSHVELQYTDGKQLMNILGPLVKVRHSFHSHGAASLWVSCCSVMRSRVELCCASDKQRKLTKS
jgi:regulator of nonsense transcripts 1